MKPPPAGSLTMGEAAKALGVSRGRVYALVQRGQLVPVGYVPSAQGPSACFDPKEIASRKNAKAAAGTAGIVMADPKKNAHLTTRAFELFRAGRSLEECVAALQESPSTVRKLYAEWQTPLGESLAKANKAEEDRALEIEHDAFARGIEQRTTERRREARAAHAAAMRAVKG